MEIHFQKKWDDLIRKLNQRFQDEMDIQKILFVIGLQEVGIQLEKLNKDQKLDVMHVAICTLLEPYGYYEYDGRDKDNWPHWKVVKSLPRLSDKEQEQLIKQGIIDYLMPLT
ncbi:MAG: hypothetical protein CMO34_07785 [Verrucomicrobia bacterium]|nr:hypothetical protein [Verrucomicrobiota bacterium]|tara:strand:+ start:822 stop:1157 length:336 start_codon:yes stop_codon:yes gene_type:complete